MLVAASLWVFCSPVLSSAATKQANREELWSRGLSAADLGNLDRDVRQLWSSGFSYVLADEGKAAQPADRQFADFANYLALSGLERQKLESRHPALHALSEVANPEKYRDRVKKLEKVRSSIRELEREQPGLVKELIRSIHSSQEEIRNNAIDEILGIEYDEIETSILGGARKFPPLGYQPREQTQTDYRIVRAIFHQVTPSDTDVFYDLGSGYGRLVLYGAALFPKIQFKGIEIVAERANQSAKIAKELNYENVRVITKDVLKVDYSDGTIFYLFNPFPAVMDQVMDRLKNIAKKKKITIIALGRSSSDFKAAGDWLKIVRSYGPEDFFLTVFASELKSP